MDLRASLLTLLLACGADHAPARTATTTPPAVATSASATAPAPPPPNPPPARVSKVVVFRSRDEVPEGVRAFVPANVDFRAQALVGMLAQDARMTVIVGKPATVRNANGVLQIVGVVVHVHPKPRECPGGIDRPPTQRPPSEDTIGLAPQNFLIVVDAKSLEGARSFDVTYQRVVEDDTDEHGVYVDPNAPCPPYPQRPR